MPNTFLTLKSIARRALPRLMDELVFPNLIYRDFAEDFKEPGDTVQIRKPVRLSANAFDENQGVSYEDIRESTVDVTLDTLATVDVAAGAVETAIALNSEEALMRDFIEPATQALAEKINSDGLSLYRDVAACVGTAGSAPSALSDLAAVRKRLNEARVPAAGRVAVLDPEADAGLIQLPALVNAEKSGDTRALREGSLGRVYGIDFYSSQAVKRHESALATATGLKLASAVSAGQTLVSLTGTALSGKLVKGDVLVISGDYYTVTQDSAPAASNAISGASVSPALKAPSPSSAATPRTWPSIPWPSPSSPAPCSIPTARAWRATSPASTASPCASPAATIRSTKRAPTPWTCSTASKPSIRSSPCASWDKSKRPCCPPPIPPGTFPPSASS